MHHFGESKLFFFLFKMVRYSNRTYKRRNYRRKTLSTSRIYSKTSAKNQAKQIMALRNKMNSLSRLTRKEIHNSQQTYNKTFTNSALSSVFDNFYLTADFMAGQWTKLRGLSINGILEYGDNRQAYPGVDFTRSGSIRIIIYQNIQSRNIPVGIQAIANISNTGTDYELNTTRPLNDGVSSFVKILYDRTYNLSDQQPQKRVRIYLRRLLNLHKETNDVYPRGQISIGLITSGLHWTTGGYNEQITASLVAKQVYTED